jgi:hydrogenase-4 component F
VGIFAVTGVPPFGTFLAKFSILSSGAHSHHLLVLALAPLFGLVFVGFLQNFTVMIFGNVKNIEGEEEVKKGEAGIFTIIPIFLALGVLVFLSVHIPAILHNLIATAAFDFTK